MAAGIPEGIRAVFFDAVGTLLHPEPSPWKVYGAIGRRFGTKHSPETIQARYRTAFARQEALDQANGLITSEEREKQRWRCIVAEVLDDVDDAEGCFRDLYGHFSRPNSWRADEVSGKIVEELVRRGFQVGLASNFDQRLRQVAGGLSALAGFRHLVISSEVGYRKPAFQFFQAMCAAVQLAPAHVLMIGDDWVNDWQGARATGLSAIHVGTKDQKVPDSQQISRLAELLW